MLTGISLAPATDSLSLLVSRSLVEHLLWAGCAGCHAARGESGKQGVGSACKWCHTHEELDASGEHLASKRLPARAESSLEDSFPLNCVELSSFLKFLYAV